MAPIASEESPMRTFVEVIRDNSVYTHHAHTFVRVDGTERVVTFPELWKWACQRANRFRELGLKKGDRVALILPDPDAFVLAFIGVRGILDAELDGDLAEKAVAPCEISIDDLAFLQFTSGSTRMPKGVMVSHRNLSANAHAIMFDGLHATSKDRGVTWLPLYHDMGLIGFVIGPIYHRNTITFLPPFAFLKRPVRWLQTISRHRATISFGPNFAYALCCKRIKDSELAGLDLSSWRVAGCGAEPIRAANLEALSEKFASVGFDPRALLPCYGMAEATLAVSFAEVNTGLHVDDVDAATLAAEGLAKAPSPGAPPGEITSIVSCGRSFAGHEVLVFAEEDASSGTPLPDRQVGELRVRGPSITSGYFNEPTLSREAFAGGWLRTGDLGYCVDGEVFVCGRSKELIILNGRNYYPQDLEWSAGMVEGVRKGNVVGFGTRKPFNDRERVVVCVETAVTDPAAREALKLEVQRAVRQATGLAIDDVVAVDIGVLPKTSSGKLRRGAARELYESGKLFIRASARSGSSVDTAKELAKSQLGYLRDAIFSDKKQ